MEKGHCLLCGNLAALQDSHIYPRFAYKRYVANQDRGGSFVNLESGRHHNKQLKRFWFCENCEKKFGETYGASFLDCVESNSHDSYAYESEFLRFVVSLTWRVAKLNHLECPARDIRIIRDSVRPACGIWQDFLRDKRRCILPYSIHAFIAFGQDGVERDVEWHKCLGGQIFPIEKLVVIRLGPLLIVGLLDRKNLTPADLLLWESSEVRQKGGWVRRIQKQRQNCDLTEDFCRVLNRIEERCIKNAASVR